jgi:hypothetical protein
MEPLTEQQIKQELLQEAGKENSHLLLIKSEHAHYVQGHCSPEETRADYVDALQALLQENAVRCLFDNKDLALYECTRVPCRAYTIAAATEKLEAELHSSGAVYKIHSTDGEYVQCGEQAFNEAEIERIVFLKALQKLHHSGKIRAALENRHLCRFELTLESMCEHYSLSMELPLYEEVIPAQIAPTGRTLLEAS